MAGGEPSSAADTGTALWTSPEQTEPTWMIYRRVRTRWGRYRGKEIVLERRTVVAP